MKPRIFISSTVYDFKDLRSALKYYLESFGYEVSLSEFNDFTKKLDMNSYQACLDTITKSDYFVLLIGSRVGGYYDEVKKISITQKEYQTAYELVLKKKLKIIAFVRDEIWGVKDDRKALENIIKNNFLLSKEIDEVEFEKIIYYKSNVINDAQFIFNFIDEVSRKLEMKNATKGKGDYPINNWIHQFKYFDDIINVLTIEFNIKKGLFEESITYNLRLELKEIVKQFLTKINGSIRKQNIWGHSARLSISKDLETHTSMKYQYFKWLTAYISIGTSTTVYMRTYFIEKALESGIFLDFDNSTGEFKQTTISSKLAELKSNIEHLIKTEELCKTYSMKFLAKYDYLRGSNDNDIVTIDNIEILPYIAAYDLQENVLNLSIGIMKSLDGNDEYLTKVKLNSPSPFESENEKMKFEIPVQEEIMDWINSQ